MGESWDLPFFFAALKEKSFQLSLE